MVDEVAKHLDSGKGVPVTLLVYVEVKNDRVDDFLRAMAINAGGSRLEEGCYRFDVLRDPGNPCKFTFYEAYENGMLLSSIRPQRILKHGLTSKPQEGLSLKKTKFSVASTTLIDNI